MHSWHILPQPLQIFFTTQAAKICHVLVGLTRKNCATAFRTIDRFRQWRGGRPNDYRTPYQVEAATVQATDRQISNLILTEPSAGRCDPSALVPMPVTSPEFQGPIVGRAGA